MRSALFLTTLLHLFAAAALSCPDLAKLLPGLHRVPTDLSAAQRQGIIAPFAEDGRPIVVITDATYQQKSGVVTMMKVLEREVAKLTDGKVKVVFITPKDFPHVNLPYQDLVVGYAPPQELQKRLRALNPQAVHLMVEGPLGKQAKQFLKPRNIPYTTAYHTEFPEYVYGELAKRPWLRWLAAPIRRLVNWDLRRFHSAGGGVMVPTETMAKKLIERGGYPPEVIRYWSHGVDIDQFHPSKADPEVYKGLKRPISLFVGRVAVEKNLEDFLKMEVPGTKVIIGTGPQLKTLQAKYPDAVFLGGKTHDDLPRYFASAVGSTPEERGVFVFPSLTDTFGLVQLEANASGLPVVAYRVQGPVDVITSPQAGILAPHNKRTPEKNVRQLEQAWHQAVKLDPAGARNFAEQVTWEKSTLEFLYFLKRLPPPPNRIRPRPVPIAPALQITGTGP